MSQQKKIRRDVCVDISLFKVYRTNKVAFERQKGNVKEQYHHMYDYYTTVCKYNISSIIVMKIDRMLTPPTLLKMGSGPGQLGPALA